MIDLSLLSSLVVPSGGSWKRSVSVLANVSACLFRCMERVSWVGFYLREGDEFLLGPFQGKVACMAIPLGKGVCGTAAREKRTLIVPDVRLFPGHIACDSESRSEIVVPLMRRGEVVALLDIDSTERARFTESDASVLSRVASLLVSSLWPR